MTNNQQLKAHCEDVIANPQDHPDWVVDMARVALASLEAEPVAWICKAGADAIKLAEQGVTCGRYVSIHPNGADSFEDRTFIYTAPPVPELKLPEEKPDWESEDGHDIDYMEPSDVYAMGKDDGFNKCLTEVKRLNGVTS